MAKLTFDEALQSINEERPVSADDVQARALRRKVWTYRSSFPGCLPYSQGYATSKHAAIECLSYQFKDDDTGTARGWRNSLERFNGFHDGCINHTIERCTLADCVG